MIGWIVVLMMLLEPVGPRVESYRSLAEGIDAGAREVPLFVGENGHAKTLSLLVSLAWFESRFDVRASGDGGKSRGLFQVQAETVSEGSKEQTVQAARMIRQSFQVCKGRPLGEMLGWYASGGPDCTREGGLRASRNRVAKAQWLLMKAPPPAQALAR